MPLFYPQSFKDCSSNSLSSSFLHSTSRQASLGQRSTGILTTTRTIQRKCQPTRCIENVRLWLVKRTRLLDKPPLPMLSLEQSFSTSDKFDASCTSPKSLHRNPHMLMRIKHDIHHVRQTPRHRSRRLWHPYRSSRCPRPRIRTTLQERVVPLRPDQHRRRDLRFVRSLESVEEHC
jgi:hypothetical protein